MTALDGVRLIRLPRIEDVRGNLSFVEGMRHVPFEIRRAYWVYDVPGGEARGGHANRTLDEVVIALSGSFDVRLDDGEGEHVVSLNRSYLGVLIPRMIWRRLENFSTNSVCLTVASAEFQESDYIRDYDQFAREAAAAARIGR